MKRILILTSDAGSGEVIRLVLSHHGYLVTMAEPHDQAVESSTHDPECILIDVPGAAARGMVEETRRRFPTCSIVVLGSSSRLRDVVDALDAGADDFVRSPYDARELVARLRVIARARDEHERVIAVVQPAAAPSARSLNGEASPLLPPLALDLKPTQHRILDELSHTPGAVISYRELNQRVWGYSNLDDTSLLRGHIGSLRLQLREHGITVRTARGMGYALDVELAHGRGEARLAERSAPNMALIARERAI